MSASRPHRFPARPAGLTPLVLAAALGLAPPARAHEPLGVLLEAASRSLAADPGDAALWLRRAELRRRAGDPDGARFDLDRAGALDARLPGLALSRATLALDRDLPDEALRVLETAPAARDEEGERWRLRALAFRMHGETARAIHAWDAAIARLERVTPDHYLERARLQHSIDREEDARRGLERGIARLGPALGLTEALRVLGGGDRGLANAGAAPAPQAHPAPPGAAAPPSTDAIAITRGPFLQRATPAGITVRWRTSASTNARVWYGSAPGVYSGSFDQALLGTEHEVVLGGLSPATRYYYAVGSTTEIAAGGDSLTFVTHPVAGADVATRIWILGDSGIPGTAQNQVRDAFVSYTGSRGADVWLMLGDNAYSSGFDSEFQSGLFTPYRAQLQQWTLWPARGNHDVVRSGANNDYYEFFTLPTAAEAGGTVSGTEAYYSFDYGPVHFICLDSEGSIRTPGGAMLTWLAGDLAANVRPWTIVYFHHPPYTKGSHDSDDIADSGGRMRDMREYALPVLEAAGVDLVLTGHSHSYERSFLLDGHYGTSGTFAESMKKSAGDGRVDGDGPYGKPTLGSGPHEGVVYAVDGSGAQISGGTLDHPAMVTSLNVLGSMVVDVTGDRLDARFLTHTRTVSDSFTIVKGPATGVPARPAADGGLRLGPALPNPFRSELTLAFTLADPGDVTVEVFDAAGRSVATLARGAFPAGTHLARWSGRDAGGRELPAGVYLASLEAAGRRVTRRIALVR